MVGLKPPGWEKIPFIEGYDVLHPGKEALLIRASIKAEKLPRFLTIKAPIF
jgi:hypothetical protein